MASGVTGRKIAFLATSSVDARELAEPWEALADAGAELHLVSLDAGEIHASGSTPAARFSVDRVVTDVRSGQYAGLVLPGSADYPRELPTYAGAVGFVRGFMDADKPVAAIGHGSRLLVDADAVRGRTLTSPRSLEPEIRRAGGDWVDRPVVVDQRLITSRGPEDVVAFCSKVLSLFGEAIDERRLDLTVEQSFPASDPPPGPT
jgi:protease I